MQFARDARDVALAADDALERGKEIGPLHGVPFTVKDWIETAGLVCAAGFEERRAYMPMRDGTVVARLRAAGAILLGKTTVTDGAPVYERPNNPYDLTRMPGGSSSGEAAIIAAGGSPFGLGSDSGGSIRWPAHCCGVAALKPTNGRVPSTGHFPPIGAMSDPRTTIGPIARHAEDLQLVLGVIGGVDWRDAGVTPMPLSDVGSVSVKGLRVGWYTRAPDTSPTPETVAAVEAAVAALADAGAVVTEAMPPRLEEAFAITVSYWRRPESISLNRWVPDKPATLSSEDVERSLFEWDRFRRSMLAFMQDFDLLVCPVADGPAPPHGPVTAEMYRFQLPYSLTGWPVAVVRCGTSSEGLPIGVQAVARPWQDHVAMAAAMHLEEVLGGWAPPSLQPSA